MTLSSPECFNPNSNKYSSFSDLFNSDISDSIFAEITMAIAFSLSAISSTSFEYLLPVLASCSSTLHI